MTLKPKNPSCYPPKLRQNFEKLKQQIARIELDFKELDTIACYNENIVGSKNKLSAKANELQKRKPESKRGHEAKLKAAQNEKDLVYSKKECATHSCSCTKCTYRRCEACDFFNREVDEIEKENRRKPRTPKERVPKIRIPVQKELEIVCECIPVVHENVKPQSDDVRSARKSKTNDGDVSWRDVFTKSHRDKSKCKCKCCSGKSSRQQNHNEIVETKRDKDRQNSCRDLESQVKEISRLQKELQEKEVRATLLASSYTNLQKELQATQKEKDVAKLEALIKALAVEKMKVVVEENTLTHIRHEQRNSERFERTLQHIAEERKKSSNQEVESRMLLLAARLNDFSDNSIFEENSRKIRHSSPSHSRQSDLDDGADWHDVSSVRFQCPC